MLDFKCIISPYHLYVHNENWVAGDELECATAERLNRSIAVLIE